MTGGKMYGGVEPSFLQLAQRAAAKLAPEELEAIRLAYDTETLFPDIEAACEHAETHPVLRPCVPMPLTLVDALLDPRGQTIYREIYNLTEGRVYFSQTAHSQFMTPHVLIFNGAECNSRGNGRPPRATDSLARTLATLGHLFDRTAHVHGTRELGASIRALPDSERHDVFVRVAFEPDVQWWAREIMRQVAARFPADLQPLDINPDRDVEQAKEHQLAQVGGAFPDLEAALRESLGPTHLGAVETMGRHFNFDEECAPQSVADAICGEIVATHGKQRLFWRSAPTYTPPEPPDTFGRWRARIILIGVPEEEAEHGEAHRGQAPQDAEEGFRGGRHELSDQ